MPGPERSVSLESESRFVAMLHVVGCSATLVVVVAGVWPEDTKIAIISAKGVRPNHQSAAQVQCVLTPSGSVRSHLDEDGWKWR